MDENRFWQIVESASEPDVCSVDDQCAKIVNSLSGLNEEELVGFENVRLKLLNQLYVWPLLHANFIIQSYVSDDVFEDFRHWIILNGRERYEQTLANPEAMADYVEVEDPIEEIVGEPLMFVVEEAWQGDIEDIEGKVVIPDEPNLGDDWPSKQKLQEMYPKLFEKFWNDERIHKLHP